MLAKSSAAGTPDRLRLRLLEPREEGVGEIDCPHRHYNAVIYGIWASQQPPHRRFRGLESLVGGHSILQKLRASDGPCIIPIKSALIVRDVTNGTTQIHLQII